ncbi:MAG: polysaccharide biosynthesis/export family protein [Desulfobacterales bacterium]|nr:polysaccharide biosynthesis/export family protein [Desulfobacterales bacterium]
MFYTTPVGAQPEETGDAQGVYEFSAGDVLDVFVFEEPDLSQTVTVRSDGRISLPLIGDIVAEGRTPEMLGQKITQKLNKFIEVADVTVSLAESREKFYYVLGQVEESGQYSMSQPVTVFQALARAGGFLEWAKKSRIMIVRGKGKSEKITYFNYDAFLDGKDMKQNVLIEPGDTIVVP